MCQHRPFDSVAERVSKTGEYLLWLVKIKSSKNKKNLLSFSTTPQMDVSAKFLEIMVNGRPVKVAMITMPDEKHVSVSKSYHSSSQKKHQKKSHGINKKEKLGLPRVYGRYDVDESSESESDSDHDSKKKRVKSQAEKDRLNDILKAKNPEEFVRRSKIGGPPKRAAIEYKRFQALPEIIALCASRKKAYEELKAAGRWTESMDKDPSMQIPNWHPFIKSQNNEKYRKELGIDQIWKKHKFENVFAPISYRTKKVAPVKEAEPVATVAQPEQEVVPMQGEPPVLTEEQIEEVAQIME
jgi:hypothetical protein